MPIFDLSASVTVSARTRVKAATLEEAIEIAKGREVEIDLQGRDDGSERWLIGHPDGEAFDIHAA